MSEPYEEDPVIRALKAAGRQRLETALAKFENQVTVHLHLLLNELGVNDLQAGGAEAWRITIDLHQMLGHILWIGDADDWPDAPKADQIVRETLIEAAVRDLLRDVAEHAAAIPIQIEEDETDGP